MLQTSFISQGWECPKCKRIYSPTTSMCFHCPSQTITSSGTTATSICQFFESDGTSGICKKCGKTQANHPYTLLNH